MRKEKTITWKSVATQYNQWAKEIGIAIIIAGRPFGEVPFDLLSHTFGKHSLFLDERDGSIGLYLGNFSIMFEFIAERQVCTQPSVISLPKTLSEAPSGLRDLYLAIGENFVGHNLRGRLCSVSPDPGKAGEYVFRFDDDADQPDAHQAIADTGASMFRQIWQVLQRASERKGREKSKADPDSGAAKADAERVTTAVDSRRKTGRSGQSRPGTHALSAPRPQLTAFFDNKVPPISGSGACSVEFDRCC